SKAADDEAARSGRGRRKRHRLIGGFESRKTAEKESDVAMIAEKTSIRETDLEERYEIMVSSELRAGEFRNLSAEGSLQQAPLFQLNSTEKNMLSEIQSDEEFVQ
ncbi:hypothetical protein EJB05_47398, partial [Eragrostis curvula]